MFYVVGLGNPGERYTHTRHNIGRLVLEDWVRGGRFSAWEAHKPAEALRARGMVQAEPVELILPETFMNKSGQSVKFLAEKERLAPEQLVVVYDDVDLPLGQLKVSVGRGDGGHNGVKSIISALSGNKNFIRIRLGVAHRSFWTGKTVRPRGGGALERHVLGKFSRKELEQVNEQGAQVYEILSYLIEKGPEATMNAYN